MKFTEDAPAGAQVTIPITLKANEVRLPFITLNAKKVEGNGVSFNTKFLPIIDAQLKSKVIEIAPGNIGSFEIDLINAGNAETEFVFKSADVPEGWVVSYPPKALVPSRENGGQKTISIDVATPYKFGWHDATHKISITYQGRYFASGLDELESDEYELILVVRDRGFSATPFELLVVIILAIVIAVVILVIWLFLKKQIFNKK